MTRLTPKEEEASRRGQTERRILTDIGLIQMTRKPSKEQLIKYWTLQRYLDYCHKHCKISKESGCWTHDGAVYSSETMLKVCPYENMRKAIVSLNHMVKNYGALAFALTGEEYNGIMRIVEERTKEKVIRI